MSIDRVRDEIHVNKDSLTAEVFSAGVRKRVPLPNVCQQFGLGYRNTFEMLREMDVHFDWKHSP